jgi:hypothetical protein
MRDSNVASAAKESTQGEFSHGLIGFRGEALMRNHVKGADGRKHDIVLLSHDVARSQAQMEMYGLADVF